MHGYNGYNSRLSVTWVILVNDKRSCSYKEKGTQAQGDSGGVDLDIAEGEVVLFKVSKAN